MSQNGFNRDTDRLLDEIRKNRTELKHYIEASETRVLMKIQELNEKVRILEKENLQLREQLELVERNNKKNSILIYGLELGENNTIVNLCEKLTNLLEINLLPSDINDFYCLNVPKKPIKLDFISNLKKREVFRNCKKLKGKNIGITNDLTFCQRQDYKILRHHLSIARQNKGIKSYIKGNRLIIGQDEYTIEELKHTNFTPLPSSEPSTLSSTRSPVEEDIANQVNNTNEQVVCTQTETTQTGIKETPKKVSSPIKKVIHPQQPTKQIPSNTARERLRSYGK